MNLIRHILYYCLFFVVFICCLPARAQLTLVEDGSSISITSDSTTSWRMVISKTKGAVTDLRIPKTGTTNMIGNNSQGQALSPFGNYGDNKFYPKNFSHRITQFKITENTPSRIAIKIKGKSSIDFYTFDQLITIVPSGARNDLEIICTRKDANRLGTIIWWPYGILGTTTIWDKDTAPFQTNLPNPHKRSYLPSTISYPFSMRIVSKMHNDVSFCVSIVNVSEAWKRSRDWIYGQHEIASVARLYFLTQEKNNQVKVELNIPHTISYCYQFTTKSGSVPEIDKGNPVNIYKSSQGSHQDALNGLYLQIAPNPFGSNTTINIAGQWPIGFESRINIYDISGKCVKSFKKIQSNQMTGSYIWNAAHLPAGIYTFNIKSSNASIIKRAMLVR